MLKPGIYEQVINKLIHDEIESQNAKIINKARINGEEASRMLALYVADTIEKYLELLREKGASITELVSVLNRSLESMNHRKIGLELDDFLIQIVYMICCNFEKILYIP